MQGEVLYRYPFDALGIRLPSSMQALSDGSVLIADEEAHCVSRIGPDNRVRCLHGIPGFPGGAENMLSNPACAVSLDDVYRILEIYRSSEWTPRLVHGNTSWGVYKQEIERTRVFVDISLVPELTTAEAGESALVLGGGMTYAQTLRFLDAALDDASDERRPGLESLRYMTKRTASTSGICEREV